MVVASDRTSLRKFSVEEYHRLIRDGYFARDERAELLEGHIVTTMPHNPVRDAAVAHARKPLAALLPPGWHVRVRSAISLAESEPEPDLVVVRGEELDYAARHPGPEDIALVVEVSNSSLAQDRDWKSRIYAAENISTYWILDLLHSRLEIYSNPSGPQADAEYRRREVLELGQSAAVNVGGTAGTISLESLLPPALRAQK